METWQATALAAIAIVLGVMWGKPLLDKFKGGGGLFTFARKPKVSDDVAEWTQARESLNRLGLLEDPTVSPTLIKWREKISCGLMCLEKTDDES